jgi:hypothetical protein
MARSEKSWTPRRDLGQDNWLGSVDVEGIGRSRPQPAAIQIRDGRWLARTGGQAAFERHTRRTAGG